MTDNIWLSRLTLSTGGKSGACSIDIDRKNIKDEVIEYKEDTLPVEMEIHFDTIDMSGFQEISLPILIKELEEGRLRQGWGWKFDGLSTDLGKKNEEQWITDFIKLQYRLFDEEVKCDYACGRYKILKQMLEMDKGDIIFIPRIPNNDSFTVAKVKGGYHFDSQDEWLSFCHVVDVEDIISFKYKDHFVPKVFNPYQRAVNKIKVTHISYPIINEFLQNYYL